MGAQEPDACGELLVGGGDHPAFADRQVLVREEAERRGEPEAADLTAVDAGPERVRGILKKKEVALLRQPRDGSELAGMSAVAHVENRACRRPDRLRTRTVRHPGLERARDVDEDRRRADVAHRVDSGDEGERGDEDLVARPEPGGEAHQVQCRGAARDRARVRDADVRREGRLELRGARPHAEPTGAVGRRDARDVLVRDDHVREWNLPRCHPRRNGTP